MSPRKKTVILVGFAVACALAGVAVVTPANPSPTESSAPTVVDTQQLSPTAPRPNAGRVLVEVDPPESRAEDEPGE